MTISVSGTDMSLSPAQRRDAAGDIPPPRNASAQPAIRDTSSDATDDGAASAHDRYRRSSDQRVPPAPQQQSARAGGGASDLSGVTPVKHATTSGASPTTVNPAQALVDRYDGGSGPSRSYTGDQRNMMLLGKAEKLAMTGQPPEHMMHMEAVIGLGPELAQMDNAKRADYAARAFSTLRQPEDRQAAALVDLNREVSGEMRQIRNDPVRRIAALFNPPLGVACLQGAGKDQMAALRQQHASFVAPGASAAAREQALEQAVRIRTGMQADISRTLEANNVSEQKAWSASAQRVGKVLDEAEKYTPQTLHLNSSTDDPEWNERRLAAYAKTYGYQSIGEKLLSDDGLSRQERDSSFGRYQATNRTAEEKTRDLLTFQEGMNQPDSAIYRRVKALETQALDTLTHNDNTDHYLDHVDAPATYAAISRGLPPGDDHYVGNLAKRYQDTVQDIDQKSRQMMRESTPDTFSKVQYGMGKFVNSFMPPGLDWLAGQLLDTAVPDHGGLSAGEETAVDAAANVVQAILAGVDDVPSLKGKVKLGGALEAPRDPPRVPESVASRSSSHSPIESNPATNTFTEQQLAGSQRKDGSGASQDRALHARAPGMNTQPSTNGANLAVPAPYARKPDGNLQADLHSPGVLRDDKGQAFIRSGDQSWPVRYDRDNGTWRVYDPHNPTKYQYPVTADGNGRWQGHNDVGLKGGAPRLPPEKKQQAIEMLRQGNKTQATIARELGISQKTVSRIAEDAGAMTEASRRRGEMEAIRPQAIAMLRQGNKTQATIARELGISILTVSRIAANEGVEAAPTRRRAEVEAKTPQAIEMLRQGNKTQATIASELGISPKTVSRISEDAGAMTEASRRRGEIEAIRPQAIEMLRQGNKTQATIARELEISLTTVSRIAEDAGAMTAASRRRGEIEAIRPQAIEMLRQGNKTQATIVSELGISQSTVSKIAADERDETAASRRRGEIEAIRPQAIEMLRQGNKTQATIVSELGISQSTVSKIAADERDETAPSRRRGEIEAIRPQVIEMLRQGTKTRATIASELGISRSTMTRIVSQAGVSAAGARRDAETAPAASTAPREPGSPQPGTSTGGHTYPAAGGAEPSLPAAKRQRLDEPQPGRMDPAAVIDAPGRRIPVPQAGHLEPVSPGVRAEVIRRSGDQVPVDQIAQNLGITPDDVNRIIDRYLLDEAARMQRES